MTPSRARAELDAASWSPPEQGLHLQHWFLARARAELALYEDDREAMKRARERPHAVPRYAARARRSRARRDRARPRAVSRSSSATSHRRASGSFVCATNVRPTCARWTLLLEAAADQLEGRTDDARAHLADATALCEAAGMQVISCARAPPHRRADGRRARRAHHRRCRRGAAPPRRRQSRAVLTHVRDLADLSPVSSARDAALFGRPLRERGVRPRRVRRRFP